MNSPLPQLNDIKLMKDNHNSYKLLSENNINGKAIDQKFSSDVNKFNDIKLLQSMHTR